MANAQITYLLNDAQLISPPTSVIPCGAFLSETPPCMNPATNTISVFQEQSEFALSTPVTMDATAEMVLQSQPFAPTTLNPGSCVNSFYLVFNPSNDPNSGVFTASGMVRFSNPVIGFIFDATPSASSNLYGTSSILGASGTTYQVPTNFTGNYKNGIGYELTPGASTTGNLDAIQFLDAYTLDIQMTASWPGDQLRIFTACCGWKDD